MPTKIPKHVQITKDLLKKIKNGTYPPKTLIPREIDLMNYYHVSRPTIRQAIQTLVDRGLLEKRKRRGTIVKQTKIAQQFTQVIEGYDKEMSGKGLIPTTKVLFFQSELANNEIATGLRLTINDPVFKLIRLRYANFQPVVLITSYIPKKIVPNLMQEDFSKVSLYNTLEKKHASVQRVKRRLEVLKANETTADLLNIARGEPIFYFHTQGLTAENIPVEYSVAKYRGDLNYFEMDLQR